MAREQGQAPHVAITPIQTPFGVDERLGKDLTGVYRPGTGEAVQLPDLVYHVSDSFAVAHHPNPLLKYHSVLIPRREGITCLTDLNTQERQELPQVYSTVTNVLARMSSGSRENFRTSYITAFQTGNYPGRISNRFYVHLLPRSENDRYTGADDSIYTDLYENGHAERHNSSQTVMDDVQRLRRTVNLYVVYGKGEHKERVHEIGEDEFCKPTFRSQAFHETDSFYIAYNTKPIVMGHVLIVSKNHIRGLLDLKENEIGELFEIIDNVVPAVLSYSRTDSYDLKIRSGSYSGRTVDHFHIHIIPRPLRQDGSHEAFYYDQEAKRMANAATMDIEKEMATLRGLMRLE